MSTRPSPVEWLDRVPAHWRPVRLKYTVLGCKNGVWGDEPNGEDDITCVRVADFDRIVGRVILDDPTRRSVPASQRVGRVLQRGDLLLEKSGGGATQPVGAVVLYDYDHPAVCSNFVARMPTATGFDSRFLCYLHGALYAAGINTRWIKQTTGIQNLDSGAYLTELVEVPSSDEQHAIADYLDERTAAIDALISKRERHIALLEEKRQAALMDRVTRGIDLDAPMRESGVSWLGAIPAHWRVARIKHVARLESGHTPDRKIAEYWTDGSIPWVSLKDTKTLASTDYISDTAECTTPAGLANSSARLLPAGTVVFTRDATIGLVAIATRQMAVSQHLIGWVCGDELLPEYLLRVIEAMRDELDRLTFGATIKTIGMDDVKELMTPLPPVEEQRAIVAAIRAELERHDGLIARLREQIEKLREYRQTLISAAVTGQLPVREEVPA
jgi:type I restriction enzyme S subunit